LSGTLSERLRNLLIVAALLCLGAWTAVDVRVSSDLARFMPVPQDADERMVVDEIGKGPGTRILLLAIAADFAPRAASLSRELRRRLDASDLFERTWNGETDLSAELARLLPLRFAYSPAMDTARFDRQSLADTLRERLADLGAAGDPALEDLLAHDPQMLTLAMVESWIPSRRPIEREGVWFSQRGEALLLVETRATGFDPTSQASAVAQIEAAFAAVRRPTGEGLVISGPGSFSVRMNERVSREAGRLGAIAVVGLVALLLAAYRSPAYVVASVLPLACAAASGLAAVRVGFGEVHGITLAFAFTLIGVAQDYPVHLMSHARPGFPARAVARELWPTLRLGVFSTILAYLTLFSGRAAGLAQLSVFTIAGLLTAALVTRYLLPALLPEPRRDVSESPGFAAFAHRLRVLRAGGSVAVPVVGLLGLALYVGHGRPWWNNDLASLTPLPPEWLAEDTRLRSELIAPDVRNVLVLSASDIEGVLRLSERLVPRFDDLRARRAIADDGLPSRFAPSLERRRARIARLPAPVTLRTELAAAADEVGFAAAYFDPMISDVAAASAAIEKPLSAKNEGASAIDDRLRAILRVRPDKTIAMVQLSGLTDADAVRDALAEETGARLVDLKSAAERLVAGFRERVLWGLASAVAALAALLGYALGGRRALRVFLPVAYGIVVTVAILRILDVELTLFHLMGLMLAAGLGVDYSLFFHRSGGGPDAIRTLHSVLLSAASTLLAFGLLATSSVPVLHAIGLTVGLGVTTQFAFALLLARDA
jgi:predicted exporter